jgi:neutral ceramidase
MTIRKSGNQLLAGSARREITPAVGVPLSGFIARLGPSTDVSDPLFTRALVLTHRDTTLVLLQMDLLGLARWHVDEIRRNCRSILGIPPECVLISTTHTHSGPGMLPLRGCLVSSLEYQWSVVKASLDAIVQAHRARERAQVRCNRVPFRLGVNRRQETPSGIVLGVDPKKPAPRLLDVAEVSMRGGSSCLLFSHAAHPYILGGAQTLISGDFPSLACQSLETSAKTTAMFLNGCAGDIAPMRAFEGVAAAREEGERLAACARSAMNDAREIKIVPLGADSEQVYLPYAKLPSVEQLEALRLEEERTVRSEERSDLEVRAKIRAALDDWADCMKKIIQSQLPLEPVLCEVQVLRMGDLSMVAISGEPFFETGQRISKSSARRNVWPLGCCNAYAGYLPTKRSFQEGGYEVTDSFRYLDAWQLHPLCERIVVKAAQKLLAKAYA